MRVKVCYVAGAGRSGSTLLDVLLGELDGFFSAGELRWLWYGLLHGWRCGCGSPVRRCPVWRDVLDSALGRATDPEIREVLHLQQRTVRLHLLPRLLAQGPGRRITWSELATYADVMARLYSGIAEVTGARVVVDSSKNAAEAALLRLLRDVDAYMVQLTRDPRAVAHSMKRRVRMEPMACHTFEQPRHASATSALIWLRKNSAAHATRLRYGHSRAKLLRYEDVVRDAPDTLRSLAAWVGEPFSGVRFPDARSVQLGDNHTAWGNPSRFRRGTVELRADDEWVARLGAGDKLVPTVLAIPLLLRYGYALRGPRRQDGRGPLADTAPQETSVLPS
jgi:hypothetical protein